MRSAFVLVLLAALVQPLAAEALKDRLRDSYRTWNALLDRGDSATVRTITQGLLSKEALAVSTADYGEMQALVALRDVAARACILEGAWEDGVAHLQLAASTAADNLSVCQGTFARLRKDHETSLAEWRDAVAKQEQRLRDLESQPGLTEQQMQLRSQLRAFIEERKAAIAHSEWSLKEMETILVRLQREKDAYAASHAAWQGFLEREKEEMARAGDPPKYVAEKLLQVKADDARPRFDRLAYGRRLQRLDPENPDVKRFVNALLGADEEEAPPPPSKKKPKAKK